MRWYVSIGVVLVAGVLAGGDVASFAAPYQANRPGHQPNAAGRQLAEKEANPTVDVELYSPSTSPIRWTWTNSRSSGKAMRRRSSPRNFCRR